jgi:hypothetical protein
MHTEQVGHNGAVAVGTDEATTQCSYTALTAQQTYVAATPLPWDVIGTRKVNGTWVTRTIVAGPGVQAGGAPSQGSFVALPAEVVTLTLHGICPTAAACATVGSLAAFG